MIANLFPESVHVVARLDAGLDSIADLKGKRVSIDVEGSGTRVDALLVLQAYGVTENDIDAVSVPSGLAADMLRANELDAFIFVAGTPANAVAQLAADSLIEILPLDGPEAEDLIARYPFFSKGSIASATYFNVGETPTVTVGAQWLVSADVPEDEVYQISKALWHENTRRLLDKGHPKGRLIQLTAALEGQSVPLHPGAERFYREIGELTE